MEFSEQEILSMNGVDRVVFYNGNAPLANNIFTACLFINTAKKRIEARGVAICSLRDTFCRKEGKEKAKGRAMKAIVRKINDYKINPKGREDEKIKRTIKVKNEKAEQKFVKSMIDNLVEFDRSIVVDVITGNGKYQKEYRYDLPLNYPIMLANKEFRYKSQYRPNPSGSIEVNFLKPPEPKKKEVRKIRKAPSVAAA